MRDPEPASAVALAVRELRQEDVAAGVEPGLQPGGVVTRRGTPWRRDGKRDRREHRQNDSETSAATPHAGAMLARSGGDGEARRSGLRLVRACGRTTLGALVAHRPLHAADVEEADLAEVDRGEGMTDERIEPRLVYLDVEHSAAARRNERGLDVVLMVRHVRVDPRAVQDCADDVEVDVEARPRVDDPEAHRF